MSLVESREFNPLTTISHFCRNRLKTSKKHTERISQLSKKSWCNEVFYCPIEAKKYSKLFCSSIKRNRII